MSNTHKISRKELIFFHNTLEDLRKSDPYFRDLDVARAIQYDGPDETSYNISEKFWGRNITTKDIPYHTYWIWISDGGALLNKLYPHMKNIKSLNWMFYIYGLTNRKNKKSK